jgi:hypothetical protein
VAVLNVTIALQSKLSEKTAQANVFGLVTTVSRILREDLDKTGYNMGTPPYITNAAKDTIEVCYKANPPPAYPAGSPTRVKYYAGRVVELASTTNPRDRILYKSINGGTPSVVAKGVDSLSFQYFDGTGAQTAVLNSIKSFSVYLVMATGEKVNGIYPAAEWKYVFYPFGMY